jgi:hypothetical protein
MERKGLADLRDKLGNPIDINNFNLSDNVKDKKTLKTPNVAPKPLPIKVTPSIPEEYKGKTWQELFRENKLEYIRQNHFDLFEKLRKKEIETL